MSANESPQRAAFSVNSFCAAYGISRQHLYTLWADGLGPARFKVGKRTLISIEAADIWRRRLEQVAAKAAA